MRRVFGASIVQLRCCSRRLLAQLLCDDIDETRDGVFLGFHVDFEIVLRQGGGGDGADAGNFDAFGQFDNG